MSEKVWKVCYNWIFVSSLTMTGVANAACTPTPDCATIGYTETSCETDYLACPFDNTKLKCMPCDSTYRYSCIGENISKGIGDICNNKYVSCECEVGTTFVNGDCVCDTSCDTVGNIYYADGSCSSCVDNTKNAVGIIAYQSGEGNFVIALEQESMSWSADQYDSEGNVVVAQDIDLADLPNNFDDYDGRILTLAIVDTYGVEAAGVAAVYCYNYAPIGFESSKNRWFLASGKEYQNIVKNYRDVININVKRLGKTEVPWSHTWVSDEANKTQSRYYHAGSIYVHEKYNIKNVRCVLRI